MGKGKLPDVLVVGAGIFGLSCAFACVRRGLQVVVADAGEPGSGASGGPVGALSPHPPANWSPKKQFQLEALLSAEAHWRGIAERSGIDPGYGRIGRAMPLTSVTEHARAATREAASRGLWPDPFAWSVQAPGAVDTGLDPWMSPFGVAHETLSARIDPPRAMASLAAAVRHCAGMRFGWRALAVSDGAVRFDRGEIAAGTIVLAAGAGGSDLLEPLVGRRLGQGVKGQALLLAPERPMGGPMLYAGGLYIVPHADGTVAVGSTSENGWDDPASTDERLDAVLARAVSLCPRLSGASVRQRWAGLRPRGARADPMIGRVPGHAQVLVANGGFKIGFGIGHAVGELVADLATATPCILPPGFAVEDHLADSHPVHQPVAMLPKAAARSGARD